MRAGARAAKKHGVTATHPLLNGPPQANMTVAGEKGRGALRNLKGKDLTEARARSSPMQMEQVPRNHPGRSIGTPLPDLIDGGYVFIV